MKESTELAISLGTVFGTLTLVLSLAIARFVYRKHQEARSEPVDPVHEAKVNPRQTDDGDTSMSTSTTKRWFGGSWGLTPVAEVGPNGTSARDEPDAASARGWRESHFSRASRASARSATRTKKRPRPSRTTEMGMLEKDDDDVQELRGAASPSREGDGAELVGTQAIRPYDKGEAEK
ncbi:SPOSA6832_01147 [Sporobolomyces salmonicolor]|uniref:SPOSA6832_01147-mRNA-1:cds n=1 Tax=Sporidiobolus salmonicolor TaxID=5005 RepID=A0A0D6EI64_SPOSA|nr:SPOSA6832_01147 [Sporobolomyces salmonicolor]